MGGKYLSRLSLDQFDDLFLLKDPVQAESLLGQPILRSTFGASISPTSQNYQAHAESPSGSGFSSPFSNAMAVDDPFPSHSSSSTPAVGTPIKLVPSASAFRKVNGGGLPSSKPATPQSRGWASGTVSTLGVPNTGAPAPVQPSPSKSMVGQMSDLIFGW